MNARRIFRHGVTMSKPHDQGAMFLEGEGDRWFARNAAFLSSEEQRRRDLPLRMLSLSPSYKPQRVLEIGCSTGWRLAVLRERYACAVTGVEPSAGAIEEGKRLYGSDFDLRRGLASALPLPAGETFDLVICAYVVSWVSRSALLQTVAEIDRVLDNGGHLIINDFFPNSPERRRYHHLENGEAFTYKQDLAHLFVGTNLYRQVGRTSTEHESKTDELFTMRHLDSGNRIMCDVLQKDLSVYVDAG
jgi:SAM-dependent methyltransferase